MASALVAALVIVSVALGDANARADAAEVRALDRGIAVSFLAGTVRDVTRLQDAYRLSRMDVRFLIDLAGKYDRAYPEVPPAKVAARGRRVEEWKDKHPGWSVPADLMTNETWDTAIPDDCAEDLEATTP
jgi:hypothetical protein